MPISVLQNAVSTSQSGTTITFAFSGAVTAGSSLWGCCRGLTSTSITAIDDSVNGAGSWTLLGSTLSDGGGHFGGHFKIDNTAGGTPTVTVHVSPSGSSLLLAILEVGSTSGYDVQASQFQSGNSSTSADAVTSGTATPSVQPGLIVAASTQTGGTANVLLAGTGFASISTLWGGGGNFWESLRYTSTSAAAGTFTQQNSGSASYFNMAAFFKELVQTSTPVAWLRA